MSESDQPNQQQIPPWESAVRDPTEDAWLYRVPLWVKRLHSCCLALLVVVACALTFAGAFLVMTLLAMIGVEHVDVKLLVLPGVMLVAFAIIGGKVILDRTFKRWFDR